MRKLNARDIYIYQIKKNFILYSPIARRYLLATDRQIDDYLTNGNFEDSFCKLSQYVSLSEQHKVKTPEDYTLLTVLPNNACNFSCSYCYSAAGRNNSYLSLEKLLVAINFLIDSKPDGFNRLLTIAFMGGGEPFLSWNTMSAGIIHAKNRASERNLRLNLRIITNGSILTEEMLDFLVLHSILVSVSFEILPEIQNLQRKNYKTVNRNIHRLIDHGIPVQLNSTITPANVESMPHMIEVLKADYPAVKNVMFEPVVSQEMFSSLSMIHDFYGAYLRQFMTAMLLADEAGITLTSFAYLRTIYPLERACPGELCITADGCFTGCYCIATHTEPLFDKTYYGEVTGGKVVFNIDKYNELISENVYTKDECKDCQVKWNCGGGCFHQYNSYSEEYRREVCFFTRQFVEALVKYKVSKYYYQRFRTHLEDISCLPSPILFNEE